MGANFGLARPTTARCDRSSHQGCRLLALSKIDQAKSTSTSSAIALVRAEIVGMRRVVTAVAWGALVAAAGMAVGAVPRLEGLLWPEVAAADALAPPAQPGIPVTSGIVESSDVPEFLSGIGTVQAYNMDLIRTRVDGQITKVNFHEGQEVKAGDPLVQIDPCPYKAVYDRRHCGLVIIELLARHS